MEASPQAVEVEGVAVSFGETRALDGVDLTVGTGTVQGLLGLSERIAELDGRFTMDAVPGRGARLTANVTIPEEVGSR